MNTGSFAGLSEDMCLFFGLEKQFQVIAFLLGRQLQ